MPIEFKIGRAGGLKNIGLVRINSALSASLLTGRPGLSNGGRASHREARLLTGRPGLSQGGLASHREAGPLTGTPGLSQGGPASRREVPILKGTLGFSKGGWASHREAVASHIVIHKWQKILIKRMFL